jgi:hypothetical protein
MGRFKASGVSQTAVAAGVNATTTANGYLGALVAGAAANLKVRRLIIGVRAGASVPTSQQMTLQFFRQTARPTGTGFSTATGLPMDPRGAVSAITGLDVTTATTFGTTGPTLAAAGMDPLTFNTQSTLDVPHEFLEELIVDQGTANGLAIVNIGNALPAAHIFTFGWEWEE